MPPGVPLAGAVGAAHDYYDPRDVAREAHAARHLPDRAHRDVRGPAALERPPGARDPPCRTGACGATRPASAGRTRTTGASGSTTSTSRSPRPGRASTRSCSTTSASPRTGRRRRRRLPESRLAAEARGRSGVPALREAAARSVRGARLRGGLRAVRRERPRDRPAAEAHGAVPRHGVRDDVSVALRARRARARRSGQHARRDRRLERFAASSSPCAGAASLLVPWVQDWTFSVPYGIDQVRAQIDAARISGAKGYMLWNAEGLYTDGALAPR